MALEVNGSLEAVQATGWTWQLEHREGCSALELCKSVATHLLCPHLPNLTQHLQNTGTERSIHRGCAQAGTTCTWALREVAGRNLQARKEPSTGSVGTAALWSR